MLVITKLRRCWRKREGEGGREGGRGRGGGGGRGREGEDGREREGCGRLYSVHITKQTKSVGVNVFADHEPLNGHKFT